MLRLVVRQDIHGLLRDVEATSGVINGEHVDCLARWGVGDAVACAALQSTSLAMTKHAKERGPYHWAVPPTNALVAANVGVVWNVSLRLPTLPRDQTIDAVGARHGSQGTALVIVAGVIGDC